MEHDGISEEERPRAVEVDSTNGADRRDLDQHDDNAEGDEGSRKIEKINSFDIETARIESDHGHSSNQVCFSFSLEKQKERRRFLFKFERNNVL